MELNDELLCAYLDGELDAGRRAQVAAALENDAGGRVRLARMRAADARLRSEVPVRAAAPDDPLVQRLLRADEEPAPAAARLPNRRRWTMVTALAAGIAGCVFGVLLVTQRNSAAIVDGYAAGALHTALESAPSGAPRAGADSARILLTQTTRDGRYCRLFAARNDGRASQGIACREGSEWRVIAWEAVRPDDGYQPAGAGGALDAVLDGLGGETLEPEAERALIGTGWRAR